MYHKAANVVCVRRSTGSTSSPPSIETTMGVCQNIRVSGAHIEKDNNTSECKTNNDLLPIPCGRASQEMFWLTRTSQDKSRRGAKGPGTIVLSPPRQICW